MNSLQKAIITILKTIGIVTFLIFVGWLFYASWQWIMEVQSNATCNTPTGTQFQEDIFVYVFMSFVRIAIMILLAIPGYLYSLCPLPKVFSGVLQILGIGVGSWILLFYYANKTPFSIFSSEGSSSSSSDDYSGYSSNDQYYSNKSSNGNGHSSGDVRCPDCDGPDSSFFTLDKGNGLCKKCNGTGKHLGLDDVFVDLVTLGNVETDLTCEVCHGNGTCQTCGGNGYL